MSNLLTEKQKTVIKREYLTRLVSLILFMAALLGVFFLAYIIPYYFSVSKKEALVTEQFGSVISIENEENVGESVSRIVNRTLDQVKIIELFTKDTVEPSIVFTKIIASKNDSIKINKLTFSRSTKDKSQLTVSGISRDRDGLVDFIQALKTTGGFTSVDSPISDFAKENNISFTVNLK